MMRSWLLVPATDAAMLGQALTSVASVLVPLPTAADDHQTGNAEHLVSHGAAVRVAEGGDFPERLSKELDRLRADPALRLARAEAARALSFPDAACAVADAILAEAAA